MLFDRDSLIGAIDSLVDRLAGADARARILVVGGAAIAIRHGRPVLTQDIDALHARNPAVEEAVAAIAAERNWSPNWLNERVTMYASHFDHLAEWTVMWERGDIVVLVAPSDLLLAMKLLAGRGRRDGADIDALLDAYDVTSRVEAEEIFERYYPHEEMADNARRRLDARFPAP